MCRVLSYFKKKNFFSAVTVTFQFLDLFSIGTASSSKGLKICALIAKTKLNQF